MILKIDVVTLYVLMILFYTFKEKDTAVFCSTVAQFNDCTTLRKIIVDNFVTHIHIFDGRDYCLTVCIFPYIYKENK